MLAVIGLLYGLNGFGLKLAQALSDGFSKEATVQSIPLPLQTWQTVSAHKNRDTLPPETSPTYQEQFLPEVEAVDREKIPA
jgi:hypothetical protein